MKIIHFNLLLFLMIVGILSPAVGQPANVVKKDIFEQRISLRFDQEKLGHVLKNISEISNIRIIYDERLSDLKVSGAYKSISVTEAINRLLRGMNNSLKIDEENKTIVIKGFGEVKYIVATTIDQSGSYDGNLTPEELVASYIDNLNEFEQELSDKSKIIDELGITRGEMEASYEQQLSQFNRDRNDNTKISRETGMTSAELNAGYERQLDRFNQNNNDLDSIDPETGISHKELLKEYENQLTAFNNKSGNDSEYMNEIGMPSGEHKQLYDQQLNEFNTKFNLQP